MADSVHIIEKRLQQAKQQYQLMFTRLKALIHTTVYMPANEGKAEKVRNSAVLLQRCIDSLTTWSTSWQELCRCAPQDFERTAVENRLIAGAHSNLRYLHNLAAVDRDNLHIPPLDQLVEDSPTHAFDTGGGGGGAAGGIPAAHEALTSHYPPTTTTATTDGPHQAFGPGGGGFPSKSMPFSSDISYSLNDNAQPTTQHAQGVTSMHSIPTRSLHVEEETFERSIRTTSGDPSTGTLVGLYSIPPGARSPTTPRQAPNTTTAYRIPQVNSVHSSPTSQQPHSTPLFHSANNTPSQQPQQQSVFYRPMVAEFLSPGGDNDDRGYRDEEDVHDYLDPTPLPSHGSNSSSRNRFISETTTQHKQWRRFPSPRSQGSGTPTTTSTGNPSTSVPLPSTSPQRSRTPHSPPRYDTQYGISNNIPATGVSNSNMRYPSPTTPISTTTTTTPHGLPPYLQQPGGGGGGGGIGSTTRLSGGSAACFSPSHTPTPSSNTAYYLFSDTKASSSPQRHPHHLLNHQQPISPAATTSDFPTGDILIPPNTNSPAPNSELVKLVRRLRKSLLENAPPPSDVKKNTESLWDTYPTPPPFNRGGGSSSSSPYKTRPPPSPFVGPTGFNIKTTTSDKGIEGGEGSNLHYQQQQDRTPSLPALVHAASQTDQAESHSSSDQQTLTNTENVNNERRDMESKERVYLHQIEQLHKTITELRISNSQLTERLNEKETEVEQHIQASMEIISGVESMFTSKLAEVSDENKRLHEQLSDVKESLINN